MNTTHIHERFVEERLRLGVSQQVVADTAHVNRRAIGRYEKGENVPGGEVLAAFSCLGADIKYVLTGERESNLQSLAHLPEAKTASACLFNEDATLESPCVFSPVGIADGNEEILFKGMADSLLDDIQGIDDELELCQEPEESPMPVLSESFKNKLIEGVRHLKELGAPRKLYGMKGSSDAKSLALLPYLSIEASAGHGSIVEHEETSFMVAFDRDWLRREVGVSPQHLRLIKARGDSMDSGKGVSGDIYDGDILLVDTSVERIAADAAYIIQFDGHLVVKRIQKMFDGSISIISSNPEYATQSVPSEQASDIRIAGKVVYMIAGRRV